MIIKWEVEDGYVTGKRYHTTNIDDGDIEACGTKEEFENLIEESVDEDFRQKVSPNYTMPTWPGKSNINDQE
jgi:hypothetical protein